jgi:hypothetical protein
VGYSSFDAEILISCLKALLAELTLGVSEFPDFRTIGVLAVLFTVPYVSLVIRRRLLPFEIRHCCVTHFVSPYVYTWNYIFKYQAEFTDACFEKQKEKTRPNPSKKPGMARATPYFFFFLGATFFLTIFFAAIVIIY